MATKARRPERGGNRGEPQDWLSALGLSDFVALDVETTGLDPAACEIIEIGAARFTNGSLASEWRTFVRPTGALPQFITDLTGITDSDLASAPRFADVADKLRDVLCDLPIVGQNVDFDLSFLRASGQRSVDRGVSNTFEFRRAFVVDTSLLARVFWPELPSFSLSGLTRAFRVPLGRAHRALDDATATGTLLIHLISELPERVWRELAEDLHRLIGSTTHRSRSFFAALVDLAPETLPPEPDASPAMQGPEDESIPVSDMTGLFGPGGVLESRLSFFRSRPMQVALAERIERAFGSDEILLAEAPTGVGKSLAYLVPALRWIEEEPEAHRQVLVSSYTKVLQEQLHRKDIAEIRQAVGGGFRSAVLKGRNNYLCKRRLRALLREARNRLSDSDRIALMPLLRWSGLTKTGDISEINAFRPQSLPYLWAQVASDPMTCSGSACGASKGDFYRAAQERAARADMVFVNHALLLSDFARLTGGGKRLVLDEAHQIERAAVDAMTIEISLPAIRNILARLADERNARGFLPSLIVHHGRTGSGSSHEGDEALLDMIRGLYLGAKTVFGQLADHVTNMLAEDERTSRIRFRTGDRLHAAILRIMGPLMTGWNMFAVALREFEQRLADLRGEEKLTTERLFELSSARDSVDAISAKFETVLTDDDPGRVTWVEAGRTAHSTWSVICSAPISVGRIMEKSFWPAVESCALTSATLATGGGFAMIRESLGLDSAHAERVGEIMVESPFRLTEQMDILVPTYFPDPRQGDTQHIEAVISLATRVCEEFSRGTLILCTSNNQLERLTSVLTPLARRLNRELLSQWSGGSLPELVTEFRRAGNAVLLGAASLWEGIDVVGDALQILLVTRLPFDVPSDPWIAARCEMLQNNGHDPFLEYSLPVAALRLKQGIGRLIRHGDDRGVAVITDPRLFTARYGRMIRESLPVPARALSGEPELITEIGHFFESASPANPRHR